MEPTLSVILPNYNDGHCVGNALTAILSQSYRPREVIAIDDGSTDDSVAVLERFAREDPIVRVLRNDRNRGVVYSLGRGLELASGTHTYQAAADDLTRQGFFEASMRLLAKHPEAGLCCCDPAFLDVETGTIHEERQQLGPEPRYFTPEEFRALLRAKWELSIASSSVIMRREAFHLAGGTIPELRWHADWFYQYVAALRHGLCYVPQPLACCRIESSSYSQAGQNRACEQREVVRHILSVVNTPTYADVRDGFRIPAVLSRFGVGILRSAAATPEFRFYLSPRLVAYAIAYNLRRAEVKRRIYWSSPAPVRRAFSAAAAWRRNRGTRKAGAS